MEVTVARFPSRFVDNSIQLKGKHDDYIAYVKDSTREKDVLILGTCRSGSAQAVFFLVRNQAVTFFIEEKKRSET